MENKQDNKSLLGKACMEEKTKKSNGEEEEDRDVHAKTQKVNCFNPSCLLFNSQVLLSTSNFLYD